MEQLCMNFGRYPFDTLDIVKYDNGDVAFIGTKGNGLRYYGNIDWDCVQNKLIKGICNHLFNFHVHVSYIDILDERDMLIGYMSKSCFSIMFKKDSITEFGFSLSDEQVRELLKFIL